MSTIHHGYADITSESESFRIPDFVAFVILREDQIPLAFT
jgi:hypothetical protein